MGSYSAPISAPQFLKELVDNTVAIDTVLMDFRCTRFLTAMQSSPLWDGKVFVAVEATDNTFVNVRDSTAIPDRLSTFGDADANMANITSPPAKYPYHVKVFVQTDCTLGSLTVWASYEKRPANPLF